MIFLRTRIAAITAANPGLERCNSSTLANEEISGISTDTTMAPASEPAKRTRATRNETGHDGSLNSDVSHVLTIYLYICRVAAMALVRKCSRQTLALMVALMERPRTWQHGYVLSKETGLKSGTLYPILIRLSEQGLLNARWKDAERPGRPPRHVYRLTAAGLALAREQVEVAVESESGFKPIKAGAR